MTLNKSLLASALLLALSSCATSDSQLAPPLVSGVDLQALDTQTRPQDDFYQFANGGWLDSTEIPEIYSGYSIYHQVYEDAEKTLRRIIESAAQSQHVTGSEQQKVGDLFATWMDQEGIQGKGTTPLDAELSKIRNIQDRTQLVSTIADFIRAGYSVPMSFYISPNLKNSSEYAVYFWQGGLTLANRDFYLDKQNPNFAKARNGLPGYIKTMMGFIDPTMTEKRAQAIVELETKIAQHHWSKVDNRKVEKRYNPYAVSELNTLGQGINWSQLLEQLGLDQVEQVIINQPSYIKALDTLLTNESLETWKDYLAYNLIRSNATRLTKEIDEANFAFMSRTLRGKSKQSPRWKRGISLVNYGLGEAVGKLYVEQHFPAEAKQRMANMVANIQAVFDENLAKLEWMSEETRKAAQAKNAKFTTKIGYPDEWRDYGELTVVKGDHYGNMQRIRAFNYNDELAKLGQPIDRNEWSMTPQTVNAYYSPTKNEIVFPAARLQAPFFQLNADDAINYGAIGGVIGHEISHGFDDKGSKYDGDGNLNNWWNEADRKAFDAKTKMLVEQFNQFSPIEGMTVNGELTLGENIGDLSGVTMAYKAYIRSLNGKPSKIIDGFTGEQRFFIGYAMSRKGKYKDEAMINRLTSDPHSPLKYRVNGIYSNMDEFHQAFGVKEGDGMYLAPHKRVKLW